MNDIESKDIIKFIILSLIGIFLYFVPVVGTSVPVVFLVNTIKEVVAGYSTPILFLLVLSLVVVNLLAKLKVEKFKKYGEGVSYAKFGMMVCALIITVFTWFKLPPAAIFEKSEITGEILSLTFSIFLTIAVCGAFVVFILKSGIVEFTGTLLEPLMRPLFKLPGAAAVNMITSYVVSSAVGIFMTDKYYEEKVYNRQEAVSAAICFSTISIGFIGVLCSMTNIPQYYGICLIVTFLLVFVLTPIFVRIPPLSKIKPIYIDGTTDNKVDTDDIDLPLFKKAVYKASLKSREFTLSAVKDSFISAFKFGQSIAACQMPIVIVTLTIVTYTPLFKYLGYPFVPVLNILGIPNAADIASAVLLGFVSITLPAISISGVAVSAQSAFFVVMLSITQIIFVTEPLNALIGTKMKVTVWDAVLNFVVRTIIAIPVVALVSHILF